MAQLGKLIERLPLSTKPTNLKIGCELNRGAYGVVHEGTFAGKQVAVKVVHKLLMEAEGGEKALRSFCQEYEKLKELEHPHVIKFLGAFKDASLGPILVMERMKENLRQFLDTHTGKLTVQEQIRISLEITRGLAFLHQLTPPMVHRDLNDKNVMFTFDGVVKIGDFGQSKLKQHLYLSSIQPGMVSYMPPEALSAEEAKYDESLDIFSLGVLMLEIGTQQPPALNMVGIGIVPETKRREKDLQRMSDLHPLKLFILLCLGDDQRKRPKAAVLEMVFPRLEEQEAQRKEEFSASKAKMNQMMNELKEEYRSNLKKKDEEIQTMNRIIAEHSQQEVQRKEKLSAAKVKLHRMIIELKEEYCSNLKKKDEEIQTLKRINADLSQATTSKVDFEQEQSDMDRTMGMFVGERQLLKAYNTELSKKIQAMPLEHEDTLAQSRQLQELSLPQKDEQEDTKGNEEQKEPFRQPSRTDARRFSQLKMEFGAIVEKKDREILMQNDEILRQKYEIEWLKKQVAVQEAFELLLLEKCAGVQTLEMEIAQLRKPYCVPRQEWDFQEEIDRELALRATTAHQEKESTSHASPAQD